MERKKNRWPVLNLDATITWIDVGLHTFAFDSEKSSVRQAQRVWQNHRSTEVVAVQELNFVKYMLVNLPFHCSESTQN